MSLRERILSALTPLALVEYRDAVRPNACEDPERCASFWMTQCDEANAAADRFATQLMKLGIRPEAVHDENRAGVVVE